MEELDALEEGCEDDDCGYWDWLANGDD